jgi:poly(3-hydroxybutyrate) depolymerase
VSASQKTHFEVKGAGHYGIFSGRRWRDQVYPAVKAFILAHNDVAAPKRLAKPAAKKVVAEKPAAKPVAKTAAKPAVKVAAKPAAKRVPAKTASSK